MKDDTILERLYERIENRKTADPESSYTAKLFNRGRSKIAQKVGEEAVETVIEAVGDNRQQVIAESADLLFHLLILWADSGIKPEEVWSELAAREGVSGLKEKAARREKENEKKDTRKVSKKKD